MCIYFKTTPNKDNNKLTTKVFITCVNCHRPIMSFTAPYNDCPTKDMIECAAINKTMTTHNTYCASCGTILNNSDCDNDIFEVGNIEQNFA